MKYKIIKKIKDYFYHRKLVRSANRHITGMKNIDFRNNFVELNGVVAEARTKWKKTLDEVQTECKMKNETTEQKEIEERYNNYLKYCRENKPKNKNGWGYCLGGR